MTVNAVSTVYTVDKMTPAMSSAGQPGRVFVASLGIGVGQVDQAVVAAAAGGGIATA
jgi:hypothetical protein